MPLSASEPAGIDDLQLGGVRGLLLGRGGIGLGVGLLIDGGLPRSRALGLFSLHHRLLRSGRCRLTSFGPRTPQGLPRTDRRAPPSP